MDKTTKHGVIVVLILIAVSGGIYYYFSRHRKVSKDEMIDAIITNPKALIADDYVTATAEMTRMGDDYIKAWYDALQANKEVFQLGNVTYHTGGGRGV